MNAAPLKVAARYLGRWSAIVFFVVLLTLIFSFLGTIICAVLAGMMFGATKHVRWQAMLISLVFPAAIFGLLRAGRAPLLERQVVLLSLLCFGAFWLTYAVATAVIYFERSSTDSRTASGQKVAGLTAISDVQVGAPRLTIRELEGTWSCPLGGHNGEARTKELEIQTRALVLRVRDGHGCVSTLGTADVKFEEPRRVTVSLPAFDDTLVCI